MILKMNEKRQRTLRHVSAYLLAVGLLFGCTTTTPLTQDPAPTEAATTEPAAVPVEQTPPVTPETEVPEGPQTFPDTGMAVVEQLDVRTLESFPVQIQAVISGYLPDGCTTITAIDIVIEGTTFHVHITTDRPADAMCTMQIVPFEEVVPLDIMGLPAGSYQVIANDLSATFEVPESSAATASPSAGETGAHPVVETETGYVMAQVDVPIYDAPVEAGNEIGMIAGGQMARVTGASADGAWWRVICPDDTVGDCWVSAAPEMTTPTSPPQ